MENFECLCRMFRTPQYPQLRSETSLLSLDA